MSEFLCDTLRSYVYEERGSRSQPTFDPSHREWCDLPVSIHEHDGWDYRIPRPANNDPLTLRDRRRIDNIGIRHLLLMISISSDLDLSDQELRGLLHCYEYLHYERDSWWGEGRAVNVI